MYSFAESLHGYLAGADEITSSIVHYASSTLLPTLDAGEETLKTSRVASRAFTARVRRRGSGAFEIRVYDGIAATLSAALKPLEGDARQILDSLAVRIFGKTEHAHVVAGSLLSTAIIFVLLHEYGHIAAGHFGYRQQVNASRKVAFSYDEITDDFSPEPTSPQTDQTSKMLELEADLLAFNFLLDLSYPIFVANEDVQKLIVGREFEDWRDAFYPPVVELTFYAAAAALALIAAHQGGAKGTDRYPLPLTRMMNLSMLLLRRTTASPWASEDGLTHRLKVDESAHEQITSFFLPTLMNAIELSEALCLNIGLNLRLSMDLQKGGAETMQLLGSDFMGLVKNDRRLLQIAEARELEDLLGQLADFSAMMKPFRVRPWWT